MRVFGAAPLPRRPSRAPGSAILGATLLGIQSTRAISV